jgi:hypothetical protein
MLTLLADDDAVFWTFFAIGVVLGVLIVFGGVAWLAIWLIRRGNAMSAAQSAAAQSAAQPAPEPPADLDPPATS